jgi:hypothetical protein
MAAAVPELGSYLDAVHGFLQEMKEFSDLPRLQAQEFENIRSRLQQSEYTFQAASTVAAKVRALLLTTVQKDDLLAVLASKIASDAVQVATGALGRRGMQDYTEMCHFLVQAVWDVIKSDPPMRLSVTVDTVVTLLIQMGLRCSSEVTNDRCLDSTCALPCCS